MKKFILFFVLLSIWTNIHAQDYANINTEIVNPLPSKSADLTSIVIIPPDIDIAFNKVYRQNIGGSISKIKARNFNQGLMQHGLLQAQGRISGVQVHRPGGNPFTAPNVHIRGVSSIFTNSQPLYVIDGVPNAKLSSIAPEDVASMTILKDASQTAIYGEAGAAGVILVETKVSNRMQSKTTFQLKKDPETKIKRPFHLTFHSKIALDKIASAPPVSSREEYLEIKPNRDFGANNDWLDNISRSALSNSSGITLATKISRLRLQASGHSRNFQGVGNKTAGTNTFANLNLGTDIFDNNKLVVKAGFFGEDLRADYDLPQTFRYALAFSPTAPVRQNGTYFEIQEFDIFNPVAIQEQSITETRRRNTTLYAALESQIFDNLSANLRFSNATTRTNEGMFFERNAFFNGQPNNGFGRHFSARRQDRNLSANLKYSQGRPYGHQYLVIETGYELRRSVERGEIEIGTQFNQDIRNFSNFEGFPANSIRQENASFGYNIQAGWGRLSLRTLKGFLTFNATGRYEGSSRLQKENRNNLYKSGQVILDLSKILKSKNHVLRLRTAYGESGNLPEVTQAYAAVFTDEIPIFFAGQFLPFRNTLRFPNDDLSVEIKKEWTFGLDFELYKKGKTLKARLNYFDNRINDLLGVVGYETPLSGIQFTFGNYDDVYLKNNGWELEVERTVRKNKLKWTSGFNIDYTKTTFNYIENNKGDLLFYQGDQIQLPLSFPDGRGSGNPITIYNQDETVFGPLYGVETSGISPDGTINYVDKNDDGFISLADASIIGSGLPSTTVGWNNHFKWDSGWEVGLGLRGVYGHYLFNGRRSEFESTLNFNSLNVLQTEYFGAGISSLQNPDDRLIEKAGFTAIDYLSIAKELDIRSQFINRVTLSLTLQNPIWFTQYTGNDPTPRYADGSVSAVNFNLPTLQTFDPLSPGFDRAYYYPRTRSFVFGVNVIF